MAHYWSSSSAALPVLALQPSHPSNSSASADARPTVITQQLIDRVQGTGVAASRNQQNGTSSYENTRLQLGRTLREEFFDMIKKLTHTDVDCGQCRLLLPQDFGEHIFSMIKKAADRCSSTDGFPIDVFDVDDNRSFVLRLKHWSSKSYVLVGGWRRNFITRKGLKEGDKVGLAYQEYKLYFKHFKNHN